MVAIQKEQLKPAKQLDNPKADNPDAKSLKTSENSLRTNIAKFKSLRTVRDRREFIERQLKNLRGKLKKGENKKDKPDADLNKRTEKAIEGFKAAAPDLKKRIDLFQQRMDQLTQGGGKLTLEKLVEVSEKMKEAEPPMEESITRAVEGLEGLRRPLITKVTGPHQPFAVPLTVEHALIASNKAEKMEQQGKKAEVKTLRSDAVALFETALQLLDKQAPPVKKHESLGR